MSMQPEYLTAREFARWSRDHDQRMNRVLDGMDKLTAIDSNHSTRITMLEANVKSAQSRSSKVTAAISLLISSIVAGLATAFSGAK